MRIDRTILSAQRIALAAAALSGALAILTARAVPQAQKRTGEQIFRQQCATCHGPKGEGTSRYKKPLAGGKAIPELAAYIGKNMPPGAPKKLPAADAQAVAAYISNAFYSPLAQARSRPARIELSHLTVRQFRNTLADLIGSFRAPQLAAIPTVGPGADPAAAHTTSPPPSGGRGTSGLRAEYFKVSRFRTSDRILERVDPQVHFDYGVNGALPQQDDPYQFAMRWEGSVIAPDTGEYDFVVRTEHAARLWVNDLKQPTIDAYVKSGSDTEYRATLFLLGGRAYPLRLEWQKGVNGVDDLSRLKKKPPQPATISLEWRPPKRQDEVIPQRDLLPTVGPPVYACSTPFPPDDRSAGYERASSISKEWESAVTQAAIETAGYVVAHLDELDEGLLGADRPAKARELCRQLVARAFRRPLTPDLEQRYVDRPLKSAADLDAGVKRVALLALNSPRFLYRDLDPTADGYEVAARLSFALWDSLPDAELLKAAASGQLATREQVAKQAERMASDPRAWSKLRDFLLQWLKIDQYPDLAKDTKRYPEFDRAAAADLRTSLELFLQQTVWSEKSDFRELLLTDRIHLNGRLAKLYGVSLPPDAPFHAVSLDPAQRAGVLTHPYLLSSFAYVDNSSPIHRGVLIARSLLGRTLMPPPQAFAPLPASLHPNMTTRQRVALQTKPAACMGCHGMINPLGFTLERFDAIGRLRAEENGQSVDTTGSYRSKDGKLVRFAGVRDLAQYLADSSDARGAFVEKVFQYELKQPVQAYGAAALPALEKAFTANNCSIRKQLVETAVLAALRPPPTNKLAATGQSVVK